MEGKRVVITSDRSAFSTYREYPWYFGAWSSLPTNWVPSFLQHHYLCPPPPRNSDGTAKYATIALRCVEASFVKYGIPRDDVVVVHPNNLNKFIGKRTEFVCASSHDPLGKGPVTTILRSLSKGIPFNHMEFERLMINDFSRYKEKYNFKIIIGGAGSWQLKPERVLNKFNIDYLAIGEAENIIPKIMNFPEKGIISAPPAKADEVPPILGPTMAGLIEITRGCGLGCAFCAPTLSGKLRSFPLEKIISDSKINAKIGGNNAITLHSDSAITYGSKTAIPDEDVIMNLYKSLFAINEIKRVFITFAKLAPFAYLPDFIKKLTKFVKKKGHKYYFCQTGTETGSVRLLKKLMPNKALPYSPNEWPEVVIDAHNVLNQNNWVTLSTIVMGLPGEEKEDVMQTIELVKLLKECRNSILFPIFFSSVETTRIGDQKSFTANNMTPEQWELFVLCWKHNLRIMGRLYGIISIEHHTITSKAIIKLGVLILKLLYPYIISHSDTLKNLVSKWDYANI